MRNPFNNNQHAASNNEEWPEIIDIAMHMFGKRQTIKTRPAASSKNSNQPARSIDLERVTSADLEKIKKQDPFMYYSIPEVRCANMQMREIDMISVREATVLGNSFSCPSRMETAASVQQGGEEMPSKNKKVSRKTSISYEGYPDLVFEDEDWMNEGVSDDLLDLMDLENDDDLLFKILLLD